MFPYVATNASRHFAIVIERSGGTVAFIRQRGRGIELLKVPESEFDAEWNLRSDYSPAKAAKAFQRFGATHKVSPEALAELRRIEASCATPDQQPSEAMADVMPRA
jgi:hypothetical protein